MGAESDGIFPITKDVGLQVGAFATIIPAGSFTQHGHGRFVFRGTMNQVALWIAIQPAGGGEFRFTASAEGVDLAGTLVPLTVKLTIGEDGGRANLARGHSVFKKALGRHNK